MEIFAYTYILECANGEYYVGSTIDIERRLAEHQAGLGGRFTSTHLPVKLIYTEKYQTIEQAFRRERQLHGWSRAKKEALMKGDIELLKKLASAGSATASAGSATASAGSGTNSATCLGPESPEGPVEGAGSTTSTKPSKN